MSLLILLVDRAVSLLIILIIVEVVLSYLPELKYRWREVTRIIGRITEPLMAPFRRLIPPSKTGGLDLSPLMAIIALQILDRILVAVLVGARYGP